MAEQEAARQAALAEQEAARQAALAEQEAARRAALAEQEAARRAALAQREAARRAQQEAARLARMAEQEARRVEIAKVEAAVTIQHVIFDFTVVTFRAGIAIQDVMTGFESCKIRVGNLPPTAKESEVRELFTQQGIDPGSLHVSGMNRTRDGKQEAFILCRDDIKSAVVIGLDGTEFGQERLVFQPLQNAKAEGMRNSATGRSDVLTISWRAPSAAFVVTYSDPAEAQRMVAVLNQRICEGRKVRVVMHRPRMSIAHDVRNEILIKGLPLDVTHDDVILFSGSARLRPLKAANYDDDDVHIWLQRHIKSRVQGHMKSFDTISTNANELEGVRTVRVRFDSWEQAKIVYDSLDKQNFWPIIGVSSFWLCLPNPLEYSITVSSQQFRAQQKSWGSLRDSFAEKQGCNMRIESIDGGRHNIRVSGTDKKAVGSLKVRVENLAAGVKLAAWHRSFGSAAGQRFLQSVLEESGAFVRNDRKSQALKAFGEPKAIETATALVEAEVEQLKSLEQTIFLKRQSIGFFIRRGLAILSEELGEDNVILDISSSPCKITIKGGEEARFTLNRVIEESLSTLTLDGNVDPGSQCPICFDAISVPVKLGCGHTYCTGCLCHFLRSASDTKIFPLTCMGDENNCGTPIPIPTVQKFLPIAQFNHLLESAFVHHIDCKPDDYQYCRTPDCSQVYSKSGAGQSSTVHCPSCLTAVCSSCDEDAHEGLTCAEQKLQNDPEEQQRLTDQLAMDLGFKKCPRCNIWTEKTEGCNHMSCKCGAHFCWICVQIFDPEAIYRHMTIAHGGIYEDHNPLGPANYHHVPVAFIGGFGLDPVDQFAVQERILREAAAERENQRHFVAWEEQLRLAREEQLRLAREEEERLRLAREEQLRLAREERLRLAREEEQRLSARANYQRLQNRLQNRLPPVPAREKGGWGCTIM